MILAGFAFFLTFTFESDFWDSVQKEPVPSPVAMVFYEKKDTEFGVPVRLKIPKIEVDAVIDPVGLTSEGAMNAPKNPSHVGWYSLGSRPGEKGTAVVDGHAGWKNGIPAVFDFLYKLRKGDNLYIEDEYGKTIVFVVREIRRYDPQADASYVFNSHDNNAHLNLITCEGLWDSVSRTSPRRLVVFADKEIE